MTLPRRHRRRYEEIGHVRFLTFSCYQCFDLFQNDRIKDAFAEHLECCRIECKFRLIAWVIMPNHVHLMLVPDLPQMPMPRVLRRLKEPFARLVLQRWRAAEAGILPRLRTPRGSTHFWQRGGGYDRNIVTNAEFFEKLEYIHANPVRAEFVASETDWRWSSARWYAGDDEGLVTVEPMYP